MTLDVETYFESISNGRKLEKLNRNRSEKKKKERKRIVQFCVSIKKKTGRQGQIIQKLKVENENFERERKRQIKSTC